jgi:hypothetical protein
MLYKLYKEVVTEKECFDVATLLLRLVLWRPFPLLLSPLPLSHARLHPHSPVKVKLVIFSLHIFPADLLLLFYFIKYIECSEQPPLHQVIYVYLDDNTSRTHIYSG